MDGGARILLATLLHFQSRSAVEAVTVTADKTARQLLVDGQRFFARGVCYSPVPVGEEYGDWLGPAEPDRSIWTRDLALMSAMNINVLRTYSFDSPKDHTAFLDACSANGILVAVALDYPEALDLSDAAAKAVWSTKAVEVVQRYKSHPAILLWAFGNEKNFHADTDQKRRLHLGYVQEVTTAIHADEEQSGYWHPVCTTLMDGYLSEYFALEASYPNAVDLWCLQLYRGASFGQSLFDTYPSKLPLILTEYGADSWDGLNQREWADSEQKNALISSAKELRNWREVVSGGIVFSFQDEWWKCDGASAAAHDACNLASFGNLPDNIGNEEWWGLFSTSPGVHPQVRNPRVAVSALTSLWGEATFTGITYITADADTYIQKHDPTSTNGAVDQIATKYHSNSPGSGSATQSEWNEVGLVRFLPASPPCANGKAVLSLKIKWVSASPIVLAYGPTSNREGWPELSTSWSSRPDFDLEGGAKRRTLTVTSADVNTRIDLDLTDWWSSGQAFSVWLQPDDTVAANNDLQLLFFSRESEATGRPELHIQCDHSWAEEGWFGHQHTLTASTTVTTIGSTPSTTIDRTNSGITGSSNPASALGLTTFLLVALNL